MVFAAVYVGSVLGVILAAYMLLHATVKSAGYPTLLTNILWLAVLFGMLIKDILNVIVLMLPY